MKEILRTNDLTQAVILQTALQAAGIEAALRGEHSLGITGSGISVVVLDDRTAERARTILRGIDALPDSRPELHKPLSEIVRDFQRRQANQLWITLITIVYVVAVMADAGLSLPLRVALLAVGVAASGIVGVRNWRCPNCNRSLGRPLWQTRCWHCRAPFRSNGNSAA